MGSPPVVPTGGPNIQSEPLQPTNSKEALAKLSEQIKLFNEGVTKLKQVGKKLEDQLDADFSELQAIAQAIAKKRNNPILLNMLTTLKTQVENFSTRVQEVASLDQQRELLKGWHDVLENKPPSEEAEYARQIEALFDQIGGESSSAGASSGSSQTPGNRRELV